MTRIDRLMRAVERAHWRVVRAVLKRECGPPRRMPVNIEVDRVVDQRERAFGPAEKRRKLGRGKC